MITQALHLGFILINLSLLGDEAIRFFIQGHVLNGIPEGLPLINPII